MKKCYDCLIYEVCKYYKEISKYHSMNIPFSAQEELRPYLLELLPKHCGHYIKRPIQDGDRDSLGRLFNRKSLKLWYPNQEPEAVAQVYSTAYRAVKHHAKEMSEAEYFEAIGWKPEEVKKSGTMGWERPK